MRVGTFHHRRFGPCTVFANWAGRTFFVSHTDGVARSQMMRGFAKKSSPQQFEPCPPPTMPEFLGA